MDAIKTLSDAIQHFADYENCRRFMVFVRWPDGVIKCPYCGCSKVTWLAKAKVYRCYGDHLKQKFSLKIGTVFEDSPIGLETWLPAVWLLSNCKNGISSYELHRALGVTQKTAWFMLHRIRLAMESGTFAKLGRDGGIVEADETFIGGKVSNMHKAKRDKLGGKHRGVTGKTIVVGMLERKGRVRTEIVMDRTQDVLHKLTEHHVDPSATLVTDEWGGYKDSRLVHEIVNHCETYVNGHVHTNGIENFWSLLKRGLNGTYISVEPFHLHRYLAEQIFRYDNRATKDNPLNDADRFTLAMSQIAGKRLTYAELTGKVGRTETI